MIDRGVGLVKAPNIMIDPPGPNAAEIIKTDQEYLATSTKTAPIAVASAKGSIVTDVDGNTYIDFASGVSVLNVGHCHPKVVKAVQEQAAKLMHFAGTDYYYSVQSDLVKRLAHIAPGDRAKKVFLSNSGTESVEAAMKVARWHDPLRKQYIAFTGCFHGRTMGSLSLTASKKVQRDRYFPLVPGVTHIPYAYCFRCPYKLEFPSCGLWCAKILKEHFFETALPPAEVAALFLEPVQGEGGYIVPPKGWLNEIFRIVHDAGILLVDDEVQTGMGRSGRMWAIEHSDLVPDILCTAKSLGSGLPIGATIFPRELDFGVQGAHSNTFGGNCVACASALATLDILEEEHLLEQAEKKGKHMHKRLLEMQQSHEVIGDVRGLGMLQAIEFVTDRKSKEPAKHLRDDVAALCTRRGIVVIGCGRSSMRFIPPLNIEMDLLDKGLDVIETCIRDGAKSCK
ncbi:MAG: Glutamate-1-semialdehyde 2,1-aminomutase [Methanomassiliicoccales archaeon PtaU1.Bin124]|nr:MAG: Glutamate-1-semialdehyde 2,1-aminomutase [Methanomassiliicoccales archaeon PtaU1.Bin124]